MSKNILIVDDSAMMRKLIKKTIIGAGYTICGEATDGQQAIDLFKQLKPDLITMDITMRGMDGLTAAREIKVLDSDAKILFLSNMDEEKYKGEVEQLGGIGLVNKHKSKEIIALFEEHLA